MGWVYTDPKIRTKTRGISPYPKNSSAKYLKNLKLKNQKLCKTQN